jgi:hypothetical protein
MQVCTQGRTVEEAGAFVRETVPPGRIKVKMMGTWEMAADKLYGNALVWPAAKECRLFLGKWEVRPRDILSLSSFGILRYKF